MYDSLRFGECPNNLGARSEMFLDIIVGTDEIWCSHFHFLINEIRNISFEILCGISPKYQIYVNMKFKRFKLRTR